MHDYIYVGKKVPRIDGEVKVTGELKYMTDNYFPDTLIGKVLRAKYAHASIINIDISEAMALEGVQCVLTARDVPGQQPFGIVTEDQLAFCDKKVRYLGDPVAVVYAETLDQATKALDSIKVEYEILPSVHDPELAMLQDAPLIHDDGNIAREHKSVIGTPDLAFEKAYLIVENSYTTPWQEHSFMETEGGYGVPEPDGGVKIYTANQNLYHLQYMLSKAIDVPQEKIVIKSSPVGGGFGRKYDIDVHGFVALGALKTQRPVKIHYSREESFSFGLKRQPFKMRFRTGVQEDGRFLAHDVYVVCDIGAYASFGPAILSYGLENSCGPYYFPNFKMEGYGVYTNNFVSGAFRGFGNNQIHYGLENHIDQIAKKLGMDPIEIRAINSIKSGQRHTHGHKIHNNVGVGKILEAVKNSELWKNREEFKKGAALPWIKRGVGVAICQHGNGLGKALQDESSASVELTEEGLFNVAFTTEELGQGIMTTIAIIAAETLEVNINKITIENGKSTLPDGGPCTASRATYMLGNVVKNACEKMKNRIKAINLEMVEEGLELNLVDIAKKLHDRGLAKTFDKQSMPLTDIDYTIGLHWLHSYVAQIAAVEVNTLTGKTDVITTEQLPDAGKVINLLGYEGQAEGGTAMALGYALTENFIGSEGKAKTSNFQTYLLPTVADMPEIRVTPVEVLEETGPYGAKGLGEPVSIPGTPAIINAIADATGINVKELPASPEKVYRLLKDKGDYEVS